MASLRPSLRIRRSLGSSASTAPRVSASFLGPKHRHCTPVAGFPFPAFLAFAHVPAWICRLSKIR